MDYTMPAAIVDSPDAEEERRRRAAANAGLSMPPAVTPGSAAQPRTDSSSTMTMPPAVQPEATRSNASAEGSRDTGYPRGSREYNLTVGATSQPTMPPAFVGPKPASADIVGPDLAASNAMPAATLGAPAQPAPPSSSTAPASPSYADRYREIAAQEPNRSNYQAQPMPWWRKALGTVASIAAGLGRNDNTTYDLERNLLNAPEAKAAKNFDQAHKTWQEQLGGVEKESGLANTASEISERDARTQNLQNPPKKDETGKTPEEVTIHDLMTGENGQPRINPQTQKPFTYLEAYGAVKQAAQDTKPDKASSEKDQDINDYMEAHKLPNTAANREKARYAIAQRSKPEVSTDDAKAIADAIEGGNQPPDMKGLYRNTAAVRAELGRRGYNLVKAEEDWQATQKYLSTLNGQQQTRLRQAVSFTKDSLDQVQDIYDQWQKVGKTSGWKAFNKASLEAAKQLPGAPGDLAHRLEARVADLTSELGTVYKGGNSSTDESLKLAAKNLSSDWNEKTFKDAIGDIRKSIQIRENSMRNVQAAGVSPGSPYTPQQGGGESAFDRWKASQGKQP